MTTLSIKSRITSSSIFLPAQNRFFQHHRADHTGIQSTLRKFEQLLAIEGDPSARAPERERRPDDNGETDFIGILPPLRSWCELCRWLERAG